MIELAALLALIITSLLIVRVGTLALIKTGLSKDVAAFQAQSAFMCVGFTTSESETVVGHTLRRRIVQGLMLLGFVAVTSTVGTLVVTFAREESDIASSTKILVLLVFVLALAVLVHVPLFDRVVDRLISAALERTKLLDKTDLHDLHDLLNLDKGYSVAGLPVQQGSWMADRTLRQLALAAEGVLVLNVQRESGVVIATPASRTRLHGGDQILVYGREEDLEDLQLRPSGPEGDESHGRAIARQRLRLVGERSEDEAAEV